MSRRYVQAQIPNTRPPAVNRTVYQSFRGVHLTDPYLCDRAHSPFALNLISNNEGLPELRPGYRVLHALSAPIRALARGVLDQKEIFLAQAGTKLYSWGSDGLQELYDGLGEAAACIFFARHKTDAVKAWILTGTDYLVYDGTEIQPVSAIATVPTVLIGKKPEGGGTPLEPVNLLTPKRTEKFQGDAQAVLYRLSVDKIDASSVSVSGTELAYTVDAAAGTLTFSSPPPKPAVVGQDNVFVTYSKTVEEHSKKICGCCIVSEYGENGGGRIFLSGNPAYRNYDWWSQLHDPSFFPDLNYGVLGSPSTAIVGYCKMGRYQAIIKEDNEQDTTIFLRSPATLADGEGYFRIEPGITGVGAIAPASFVSLIDEPLFLSRMGVYALSSSAITAQHAAKNRSYFVDEALTREKDLHKALAVEWNGYYLLCLNEKVYAFHAKAKEPRGDSFAYNCFLWNNIAATALLSHDNVLYFGDEKGRICRLNTDLVNTQQYNDDGEAIEVYWATCLDNDGAPERLKTLLKKGSGITTKPFVRSTYEVFLITDAGGEGKKIRQLYRDIVDLDDMDLDRFTLESSPHARFSPFLKKEKKYQSLQILVRAKAKNEGFGIYNIVKLHMTGAFVKR